MFRLMDRQISMAEAHFWMPEGHRQELERTWPYIFRTKVLGMIPESRFNIGMELATEPLNACSPFLPGNRWATIAPTHS